MHCMDPDYSVFTILPPFNTVNAQLVRSGLLQAPGTNVELTFEAIADATGSINSTSIGKTNFWDYVLPLFGASLALDVGLAGTAMPGLANIPQPMHYVTAWSWYQAEGIPLTPIDDAGNKNPYPLMRVTARTSQGVLLASTVTSVPVSQELECRLCHASGGSPFARPQDGWVYDANPLRDDRLNILALHDERHVGTALFDDAAMALGLNPAGLSASVLVDQHPILCDACHGSNALPGTGQPGISPMTQAIHARHAGVVDPSGAQLDSNPQRSACYTCHPGFDTQCMRGAMGKAIANDGDFLMSCQSCHGKMTAVGDPDRIGWFEEPNCQSCHTGTAIDNAGEIRFASVFDPSGNPHVPANPIFATNPDTPAAGFSLYRFSEGHGGLQCSACHGSPHAIWPTAFANDNVQATQLQGHAGTLSDCSVCHTGLEDDEIQGPHGMHPVSQAWADHKHGDFAEGSGLNQCRACHGQDLRGTVLSVVQGPRSFSTDFGQKNFFEGSQIGCWACHNGPTSENPSTNHAPSVPSPSVSTPADTPITLTLQGTDSDGNALTYRIIQQPAHGTAGIVGSALTYYPNRNSNTLFVGTDSLTYAAWDGKVDSNLGSVTVAVGAPACSGSSESYGFGCPGTEDFLPQLTITGCPSPGETISLDYSNGLGGSVAFLVVGSGEGQLELFPGCVLRVDPLLVVSSPLPVQGSGAGQGNFALGHTFKATAMPQTVTFQVFQFDPGANQSISASNGVRMTLQ